MSLFHAGQSSRNMGKGPDPRGNCRSCGRPMIQARRGLKCLRCRYVWWIRPAKGVPA